MWEVSVEKGLEPTLGKENQVKFNFMTQDRVVSFAWQNDDHFSPIATTGSCIAQLLKHFEKFIYCFDIHWG